MLKQIIHQKSTICRRWLSADYW